jgi:hypothetical protein
MPRETIHTSDYPGDQSFDVKVGWNNDMGVQVGVAEADGRSMWWVYGEKYKAQLGADIEIIVQNLSSMAPIQRVEFIGESVLNLFDTTCGSFDSLWATMNRKQINDLIRILRRARDSAFGKDE